MNTNLTRFILFSAIIILISGCSKKEDFLVVVSVSHPNQRMLCDLSVTVGSKTETFVTNSQLQQSFDLKEGETLTATLTCKQGCDSLGRILLALLPDDESPWLDDILAPADTGSITLSHTYLP